MGFDDMLLPLPESTVSNSVKSTENNILYIRMAKKNMCDSCLTETDEKRSKETSQYLCKDTSKEPKKGN